MLKKFFAPLVASLLLVTYSASAESWIYTELVKIHSTSMEERNPVTRREEATRENVGVILTDTLAKSGLLSSESRKYVDKSEFRNSDTYSLISRSPIIYGKGGETAGNNGYFDPQGFITRAEFCAMLGRFINVADIEFATGSRGMSFTDCRGHWAEEYIYQFYNLGIIQGYNGMFRPDDTITRVEVSAILIRMFGHSTNAVITALADEFGFEFENGYSRESYINREYDNYYGYGYGYDDYYYGSSSKSRYYYDDDDYYYGSKSKSRYYDDDDDDYYYGSRSKSRYYDDDDDDYYYGGSSKSRYQNDKPAPEVVLDNEDDEDKYKMPDPKAIDLSDDSIETTTRTAAPTIDVTTSNNDVAAPKIDLSDGNGMPLPGIIDLTD